jgi:hypothetical protein
VGGFVKRLAPAVGNGTGSFGSATGKSGLGAGTKAESAGGHVGGPGHADAVLAAKFGGKPQRVDGRQGPRPRPNATDGFGQATVTAEKQTTGAAPGR